MRKRIDIFKVEQCDYNFPTSNAVEFNKWLGNIIDTVPQENKDDLVIELESASDGYDSYDITIEIYYYREETEAELKEKLKRTIVNEEIELEKKRNLFEKLKRELGEK